MDPSVECKHKGLKDAATAVAFSPQGDKVAASSMDKTVMLWSLKAPHANALKFMGHNDAVLDLCFNHSGR